MWLDAKYLNPFFTRRLTQEVKGGENVEFSLSSLLYFSIIACFFACPHMPICVSQDLLRGRIQMKTLTNKWYEEVRQGPSGSEDDEDEIEHLWTLSYLMKVKIFCESIGFSHMREWEMNFS